MRYHSSGEEPFVGVAVIFCGLFFTFLLKDISQVLASKPESVNKFYFFYPEQSEEYKEGRIIMLLGVSPNEKSVGWGTSDTIENDTSPKPSCHKRVIHP